MAMQQHIVGIKTIGEAGWPKCGLGQWMGISRSSTHKPLHRECTSGVGCSAEAGSHETPSAAMAMVLFPPVGRTESFV